jgi:hypothetical protein
MDQDKPLPRRRFKAGGYVVPVLRLLVGVLGLVFLVAAVLKATDMEIFIRQIRDYKIISHPNLLSIGAWGLVVLECTLGAGLLFFYRPRLTLPATALLLLIFIGTTGWAWLTGTTTDCGCFGSWLKRTTGQAAFEGLIMLAVTIIAWIGIPHSQVSNTRTKAWAVAVASLIGLLLPAVSGFSVSRISLSEAKTAEIDFRQLQIQNLYPIDLKHGMYLVVLMDTDCLHCQEGVEQLNGLARQPNVPPIIALFMNKKSELRKFEEEFQPIFSIKQIKEDLFWRLLGDGDIPRTLLLRDGLVVQMWDEKIPDKDRVSILSVQQKKPIAKAGAK